MTVVLLGVVPIHPFGLVVKYALEANKILRPCSYSMLHLMPCCE